MKNKALLLAGLGLGSVLTLSAFSLASANEVESTTDTATTMTSTARPANKMLMRFGNKGGKDMMKGNMEGKMLGNMKQGGMFMMKFGAPEGENSAIQTAITNNDYNAFVTAWNADENKPSDVTMPTQEQFTQMVTMSKKQKAIQTAIETNDYDGYVKATTPSRDEFNQIVSHHQTRQAVEAAIEAKDYSAFVSATKDTPMAENISEEQFTKMIEMHAKRAAKAAK